MRRERIVLFAGRLMENKGCQYLIKAMSVVQERIPAAKLVVIGDGPERASLEKQAAIHLKRYEFLGMQPQDVLRQWMNRASVFSVPSVTTASGTSEGFGLVFLEAQAVGTPIASFATGGIPEAVLHGETGLLAPEKDFESLAENITRLLSDAGFWRQLSTAGITRVRNEFDLRSQNAKLEAIYGDVLARRNALLRKAA
jgi:glycosyltransferase involved in cell wall biosynthesis